MATSPSSSRSSSPESFRTADESNIEGSTTASSPTQGVPCIYRDARPLPFELKNYCQILLEEKLYTGAIGLLHSALGAGVSRIVSDKTSRPAFVPPPSHLALLATLTVHPMYTSRAETWDERDMSSRALDYLRSLLALVGPIHAGFRTAFQFHARFRPGRRAAFTSASSDSDLSDADTDTDHEHDRLKGKMACQSSVWIRGQDLWTTVGWAFNTSALHPHRWRYWKAWLVFMLDVLEADWAERTRQDAIRHEAGAYATAECLVTTRRKAMIAMYIGDSDIGWHTALRHIVKALFADGSPMYRIIFAEVFDKESLGPKKSSAAKKRKRDRVLDLENDKYGDYCEEESMSSGKSEPPTPQKTRRAAMAATAKTDTPVSSGPDLVDSVQLRLRFFRLLSVATHTLGQRSELDCLYEDFALCIKGLPLDLFAHVVTQKENPFLPEVHVVLIKALFDHLLASNRKNPRKVDPEGDAEGRLSQALLEHCYVNMPANTVALEDNAKLSLLVEDAIQLLWLNDEIQYTDSFALACEKGIQERAAKVKKKRTGKLRPESADVLAQEVLDGSAERIRVLVEALRTAVVVC